MNAAHSAMARGRSRERVCAPALRSVLWALVVMLAVRANALTAQCAPMEGGSGDVLEDTPAVAHAAGEQRAPGARGRVQALLGRAPERRRFIPAFWVMHPFDAQFPEIEWTRGGGIQASTWFAAGFRNSYDRFSMIAGVERAWFDRSTRSLRYGLGYRAGILTGYDERFMRLASRLPALPFGGLLAWLDFGRVGIDTFYVYKALTVEGSFGF
jgi:hypothetical protein